MSTQTPKDVARRLSQQERREVVEQGGRPLMLNLNKWDMFVNISGPVAGEFKDWPAFMQDSVSAGMAVQCVPRPGYDIKMVFSACKRDEDGPYLHVICMEMPQWRG